MAVITLLADRLGFEATGVAVVSGHGSRARVVAIAWLVDDAIQKAFPRHDPGKKGP